MQEKRVFPIRAALPPNPLKWEPLCTFYKKGVWASPLGDQGAREALIIYRAN